MQVFMKNFYQSLSENFDKQLEIFEETFIVRPLKQLHLGEIFRKLSVEISTAVLHILFITSSNFSFHKPKLAQSNIK
jgi:hypothetical protein